MAQGIESGPKQVALVAARIHSGIRRLLCPFGRILHEIPETGRHLDVGCGHGILLGLMRQRSPQQELQGIDLSEAKIGAARRMGSLVRFNVIDIADVEQTAFDSLSVVDVLYLLSPEAKAQFLGHCYSALRPGGLVVLKEVVRGTGFKYTLTVLQEFLAVKVLRITLGDEIQLASESEIAATLDEVGFVDVEAKRIDMGYPYEHFLVKARRPVQGAGS